jgi:ABC-type glycerol-3-phosphate transport system substrate-binding protein
MNERGRLSISFLLTFILSLVLCSATRPARAQTMEELHQRALKEGGVVNFYGTLAQITAAKILAVFEKRFPGVKVNQVDATPDKLAARAIAEARGGRVLADVFQTQLENIVQLYEQGLLLEKLPPEAAAYPSNYKGSYWDGDRIRLHHRVVEYQPGQEAGGAERVRRFRRSSMEGTVGRRAARLRVAGGPGEIQIQER